MSRKVFNGALVVTSGQVASYALSFARNVILARMLTKADFGLAAVFGMTLSLLEIAGRMSFGPQIIQSKDGDTDAFLASSHAFQFSLAVAGALLIAALSIPLAHAFRVPQLVWAFAVLAFVPLTKSIEHLDCCRRQRELNYLPSVLCDFVPQLVVTLAAWPLAKWLGDFRVIVWLMLGKAGLGILMTHLLATRPYQWAWRRDYMKGMWLFGWPLLLNGLLLFFAQQADQMVVGSFLSLNELASYALVMSLVSIPWMIFGQVGSSIMLPLLSRVQDDAGALRRQYRACVEYAAVGAVVLMLPLILVGEQLVTLLYGAKYQGAGPLMALLGAACTLRFLRFVPAVTAMAKADTKNHLFSNSWRSLSLPLAVGVALLGGGVILIAACVLVAEVAATIASLLRLRRRQGIPLRDTAGVATYVCGSLVIGLVLVYLGASHLGYWLAGVGLLAVCILSLLAGWLFFPRSFASLWESIRGLCLPVGKPATPS